MLNLANCVFGQSSVVFLGQSFSRKISAERKFQLLDDHIAAIRDFLPPQDKLQLQFLPYRAQLAQKTAVDTQHVASSSLCKATCLAHPIPAEPVSQSGKKQESNQRNILHLTGSCWRRTLLSATSAASCRAALSPYSPTTSFSPMQQTEYDSPG
jgi:hypothetical protein